MGDQVVTGQSGRPAAKRQRSKSETSSSGPSTGDRSALEELYLIHFDRIYSYLHMSVGSRHDAEDDYADVREDAQVDLGRFR